MAESAVRNEAEYVSAWRAGSRAWRRGTITPEALREEAARRARARSKRNAAATPARHASALLFWGGVFIDTWLAAGYRQADRTGDTALLATLNTVDLERIGLWP
jgi:hypothetical protein